MPDLTPTTARPHEDARAPLARACLVALVRRAEGDLPDALALLDVLPPPLSGRLRLELLRRLSQRTAAVDPRVGAACVQALVDIADPSIVAVDREWSMLADQVLPGLPAVPAELRAALGVGEMTRVPGLPPPSSCRDVPWGEAWWQRRWLLRLVPLLPRLPAEWHVAARALTPEGLPDPTAVPRITITTISPASAPPVTAALALEDAVRDDRPLPLLAALEEAARRLDELRTCARETENAAVAGLRQLARAFELASRSTSRPDASGTWAAAVDVLRRLSNVDDPRGELHDPYDPCPDRPGDSVSTHATRALLNLLQHEDPGAASMERTAVLTALEATLGTRPGRQVLGYSLSALLGHEPAWTTRHLAAVLGPPPTAPVDEWDSGWVGHLAGEPVVEGCHLELLRPWFAAAAGVVTAEGDPQSGRFAGPHGWGEESRAGRLITHVCSAYLRGDLGLDDPLVTELLREGEAAVQSWFGAAAEALRWHVAASPDASTGPAGRLRDFVDQQLAETVSELPAWTALLGTLADGPVADAVGRPWLLTRLHDVARSGTAPVAVWHVATLVHGEVVSTGAGRTADLAGRLALELSAVLDMRELELVAALLIDSARQLPDAGWSAELLSRLALRLGPRVVALRTARA